MKTVKLSRPGKQKSKVGPESGLVSWICSDGWGSPLSSGVKQRGLKVEILVRKGQGTAKNIHYANGDGQKTRPIAE